MFVKGLADGLGIKGKIISPTFMLMREYPEKNFYHLDLYRITLKDFLGCGLYQYLNAENICAVEWAEKIKTLWGEKTPAGAVFNAGGKCKGNSDPGDGGSLIEMVQTEKNIILAIDTSGRCFSVALLDGSKTLAEIFFDIGLKHSELLHKYIDTLLKETKLTLKDIGKIACAAWAASCHMGSGWDYPAPVPLPSCWIYPLRAYQRWMLLRGIFSSALFRFTGKACLWPL